MIYYNAKMKKRAQEMRKNATPQEDKLWFQFLRKHPNRFSRQKTLDSYIVDFYCHYKKLVIELDGKQHQSMDAIAYDFERTEFLKSLCLHVIRFTNEEVDNSFQKVCDKIQQALNSR